MIVYLSTEWHYSQQWKWQELHNCHMDSSINWNRSNPTRVSEAVFQTSSNVYTNYSWLNRTGYNCKPLTVLHQFSIRTASSKRCNKVCDQFWAVHVRISSWWITTTAAMTFKSYTESFVHWHKEAVWSVDSLVTRGWKHFLKQAISFFKKVCSCPSTCNLLGQPKNCCNTGSRYSLHLGTFMHNRW